MNKDITIVLQQLLESLALTRSIHPDYGDDWAEEFVASVLKQSKVRQLSASQLSVLSRLRAKYNPETLEEEVEWSKNYSIDHRTTAVRVAKYYAKTEYFSALCTRILSDPTGHTLTKKEFGKFCENKYARRVLANYESTPRFQSGDLVMGRKANKLSNIEKNTYGASRKHAEQLSLIHI